MSIVRPSREHDFYREQGVKELRFWWPEMVLESLGFDPTLHNLIYYNNSLWALLPSLPQLHGVQSYNMTMLSDDCQQAYHSWLARSVVT